MCFHDNSDTCTSPSTPTEIHERAEVHNRTDHPSPNLPLRQPPQKLRTNLALRLLQPRPPGQHHIIPVLVQLDDLSFQLPPHIRLQIPHPAHLHQRRRQKPTQPDIQNQTPLHHLDHRPGNHPIRILDLLNRPPRPLILRPLLRQNQTTFLILLLQDQRLHPVPDPHHLTRIHIMLDRQLPGRNHPLRLIPDIQQHLVPVDLDDRPRDNVAIIEILDRLVHRRQEILGRTNIIHRHLRHRRQTTPAQTQRPAQKHQVEDDNGVGSERTKATKLARADRTAHTERPKPHAATPKPMTNRAGLLRPRHRSPRSPNKHTSMHDTGSKPHSASATGERRAAQVWARAAAGRQRVQHRRSAPGSTAGGTGADTARDTSGQPGDPTGQEVNP